MKYSIKKTISISILAAIFLSSMIAPFLSALSSSEIMVSVVSATASSYGNAYPPAKAIDGIESTSNYWGTYAAMGLPQWLKLDLGSQVSVNQITTHFYDGTARVYTYSVSVSADGSSWTNVVATKTGSGVVTDAFSASMCRFVRLTVTGNTANNAAHIEEIKVFQSSTGLPSQTPTPTPTPTSSPQTPTGLSNGVPLSSIGGDYLIYFSNGDPSEWDSQLHWFTQFQCTGARLGFSFADEPTKTCSIYTYAKMNSVLNKLNSVGVKAVLCEFAGSDSHFYGSQAWINDWKQITADFKGDTRIAAFEIANEPYTGYLSPNGPTGGITNLHSFDVACSYLISQIRTIDPTRTIMYPICDVILTDDATAFYNDLVSTGVIAQGNILYDIVHPYYFQNIEGSDGGCFGNPAAKADWYWNNYVVPQANLLGWNNVWCGETFCWPRSEGYNYNDQQTFEKRFINYCVNAGMGFQVWCFFTSSDRQAQIDALNNSQYYTLIHS